MSDSNLNLEIKYAFICREKKNLEKEKWETDKKNYSSDISGVANLPSFLSLPLSLSLWKTCLVMSLGVSGLVYTGKFIGLIMSV